MSGSRGVAMREGRDAWGRAEEEGLWLVGVCVKVRSVQWVGGA